MKNSLLPVVRRSLIYETQKDKSLTEIRFRKTEEIFFLFEENQGSIQISNGLTTARDAEAAVVEEAVDKNLSAVVVETELYRVGRTTIVPSLL